MARELSKYTTFDEVMNHFVSEKSIDNRDYDRYFNILVRGYTQLTTFEIPHIKEKKIVVNDANKATLPNDLISLIKVAVQYQGRLWTLSYDESILFPTEEECGNEIATDAKPPDTAKYFELSSYTAYTKEGYNTAWYRLNQKENYLTVIGEIPNNELIIHYKSTGVSLDGETLIPYECTEALIAWLDWRLETNNQLKSNQWIMERKRLSDLTNALDFEMFKDVIYQTGYFGAK